MTREDAGDGALRLRHSNQLRYTLYRPSPALRPFVRCFWILQQDASTWRQELMIPDGYVDLIFCFSDGYVRRELTSPVETRIETSHIVGQRSQSVYLTQTQKLDLLGVKLRSFGLWALTEIPANEFTHQIVPIGTLSGHFRQLEEQLYDLTSDRARISLLERFLLQELLPNQSQLMLTDGLEALLRSRGTLSIADMAQQMHVSRKTLERHFQHYVGMSPKQFAKVIRFKAALKHLKQSNPSAMQHGYLDFGYYDQNHFIREFKHFMDVTPSHYFGRRFHSSDEYFTMGVQHDIGRWLTE